MCPGLWRLPPLAAGCAISQGALHAVGLATDDCRTTYEELSSRGVEFLQEPADRPYGVEAVMRDDSGNWLVLVEQAPDDDRGAGPDA